MQDALTAHAAVEERTLRDAFGDDEDALDGTARPQPAAERHQAAQRCLVGEFEHARVILEETH